MIITTEGDQLMIITTSAFLTFGLVLLPTLIRKKDSLAITFDVALIAINALCLGALLATSV